MRLQELFTDREILPAIRMGVLAITGELAMVAMLYATLSLPDGQSQDRQFLLFFGFFIVYILMVRRLKRRIHLLFESRLARTRLRVIQRIRRCRVRDIERLGAEAIYTVLMADTLAISEISATIAGTIYAVFILAGTLLYLSFLSWEAGLLTFGVLAVAGCWYSLTQLRIRQAIQAVRDQERRMFEAIRTQLDGFHELRLNDRKSDAFFQQKFLRETAAYRPLQRRISGYFTNSQTITYALWAALSLCPVLILPAFGVGTQGKLLTFIGIILFLPINYLIDAVPRLILADISVRRLTHLKQTLGNLELEPQPPILTPEELDVKELRYKGLRFRYQDDAEGGFHIGPLDFSCRRGEIVFLIGGNGTGKSTLLKLLTGLYRPNSGQIFLDNAPIDALHLRQYFAAIFQEIHLFDRLYGRPAVSEDRVNQLLTRMRLVDHVQYRDGCFSTLDLSSGQKKRLALVCAMLEDRPIYVFDEWAAQQDPQFRRYFYETLLPEFKAQGKTVIAVTHDDRWFHVADRVLKMAYGQIVAS